MTENEDHVAVARSPGIHWDFLVPSAATVCSEVTAETVELGATLFDAFGDYLEPVRLRYGIHIFEEDLTLPRRQHDVEPVEEIVRDLQDAHGVTREAFLQSAEVDQPGVRWIPRVPFEYNRLKIHTDCSDTYVQGADCVRYSHGEPVDLDPFADPLEIRISHNKTSQYDDVDSEFLIQVAVSLASDVWLEQSDDGAVNRRYLASFLERVADVIPYETVDRRVDASADMWADLNVDQPPAEVDLTEIF